MKFKFLYSVCSVCYYCGKRIGYNLSIIIFTLIFISGCSSSSPSSILPELDYEPTGDYILDQYIYSIDLNEVENDQVYIHLHCPGLNQDTVIFHFPKTIPGTYKELDYGEMIEAINPQDSKGNVLFHEKIGKNIFKIINARDLTSIHYWINDTWDHPKAMRRIWPMGGTNIEKDKNFVINASGWFGFFDSLEDVPVSLTINQPDGMKSYSALPISHDFEQSITFNARDYHHLIDCPIMISAPDTSTFTVANTRVFIESYHSNGEKGFADVIKKEIQPSMEAVAMFTDSLPVSEYHFIMYIRDGKDFMDSLRSKEVGLIKKAKSVLNNFILFGSGALEHGNSSFFVLTDFGDTSYTSLIKRVALHEFMHIFTPLNLHSEYIGDFDYVNPRMSKHLWLYEGITEYFANLIMVQSGLISPLEFFSDKMSSKIQSAARFPEKKMSFTEMSENIFDKKYGVHYGQVYQRGAVLGLLLDIEIIRLTDGQKTLKDIVLELASNYGPDKSFNEETFIDEFCAMVSPVKANVQNTPDTEIPLNYDPVTGDIIKSDKQNLRQWFDKYIEGTIPLDVQGSLAEIGVEYTKEGKHEIPKRILTDYGTKQNRIPFGKYIKVKKVGRKDPVGFQVGDQLDKDKLRDILYDEYGYPVEEGKEVSIFIKRDDKTIELPYTVEYKKRKFKHRLRILKNKTELQQRYYSAWMGDRN